MRFRAGIISKRTNVGEEMFSALPTLAQWALVAKYGERSFTLGDFRIGV